MRFFIPLASSDEEAESVLDSTAKFTGFPIPSPRIYSIAYRHNGIEMIATVGKEPNKYYQTAGPVIAILFRTGCYAICTANRRVLRGEPILVGEQSVSSVRRFED